MSFSASLNQKNLWDRWIPAEEVSFEELNKTYTIENGDWILEKKTIGSHNLWAFYKPEDRAGGNYNLYYLGFSTDPKSLFYFGKKIETPVVVKSSNNALMAVVKEQLNNLR